MNITVVQVCDRMIQKGMEKELSVTLETVLTLDRENKKIRKSLCSRWYICYTHSNSEYIVDKESRVSHCWGEKVTNKQGGWGLGKEVYSEPCVSGSLLEVSV